MQFIGRKALVTGASQGIGKAIALRLAEQGADVGIHYLSSQADADAVAQTIREKGGQARLFQADLELPQQAMALGERAWRAMQGIDFLVNNAGISFKKHFLDFTVEDVDAFLNVNYKGAFFLTQTIARQMVETNAEGSILSITSVNGIRPGLGQSAYGASKSALDTLMQGVALELAPHNIKVNTLALGAIDTDMTASVTRDPDLLRTVNEGIPMGRFGQPEEVAVIVCDLLASGSYLTGSRITLDGGLLLMRGYGKPEKYP